jgi:hypothetical protein
VAKLRVLDPTTTVRVRGVWGARYRIIGYGVRGRRLSRGRILLTPIYHLQRIDGGHGPFRSVAAELVAPAGPRRHRGRPSATMNRNGKEPRR